MGVRYDHNNFKSILWQHVESGDEVYFFGFHLGTPVAYGPFTVRNNEKCLLAGVENGDKTFIIPSECLCVVYGTEKEKYQYWCDRADRGYLPVNLAELMEFEAVSASDVALKAKGKRRGFRPWKRMKRYAEVIVPRLGSLGLPGTPVEKVRGEINTCEIKTWLKVHEEIP